MSLISSYQSDLHHSSPENSGYLAIYISENRCDIAICSSTFVLSYLERYERLEGQSQNEFLTTIFSKKQGLFARKFEDVTIGFQNQDFAYLPINMQFSGEKALSLLVDTDEKHTFFGNTPLDDTKLVFAISDELVNLFSQSFEKYRVVHCAPFATEKALEIKENGLLIIDKGYFDVVMKKEGKVYSINRHQSQTSEDVTYYTLLACKDAGIDPKECNIIISGLCDRNDAIHQNLKEFILDTRIKALNKTITTRPDFDQPKHYITYVLNLLNANY